ncbi:MAG: Crp/Fnr family transcriptional regulator [Methyloligellaceae bacterium]
MSDALAPRNGPSASFPYARREPNGWDTLGETQQSWSGAHANFLSNLSSEETDFLLAGATSIELAPRDMLFQAGDRSDNVFIVDSGCIKLFQLSPSGKETILWFGFHGEIFGIAELWSGADREICAMANETSRIYSISQADFLGFLRMHPEVAMRAIGILAARVRTLGMALVDIATDDVETRLGRLLLRFAAISARAQCDYIQNDKEICINIRLTHQDLANLIGASRQTVTSTLAVMRRNGVIKTLDQHIHIIQPEHLRRAVEPVSF